MGESSHQRWTDKVIVSLLSLCTAFGACIITLLVWAFGGIPADIRQLQDGQASFSAKLSSIQSDVGDFKTLGLKFETISNEVATHSEQIKTLNRDVERIETKLNFREPRPLPERRAGQNN